jgi:hypothetical protein
MEWGAIFFPALIIILTFLQFGNLCEVYHSEDKVFIDFVLRGWRVPWTDIVSIEKSRFGYKLLIKNGRKFFFQKSLEESPFGTGGSDRLDKFIVQCKARNIELGT